MKILDILDRDEALRMCLLIEIEELNDMRLLVVLLSSLMKAHFDVGQNDMDLNDIKNMSDLSKGLYIVSFDQNGFKIMLTDETTDRIKKLWELQRMASIEDSIEF